MLLLEDLRRRGFGPFNLRLADGACCVVTGPSGAGKSVFLRMIADLDPNSGRVVLDGAPRTAMPAPTWRQKVGYVPAESGWWGDIVSDHFSQTVDVTPLLAAVGLPEGALGWPVARLSTGERQRLGLVRALARRPKVLLLDEPTSALDSENTAKVELVLAAAQARGAIILLASHDAAQGERLATQRLRIEDGKPCAEDA